MARNCSNKKMPAGWTETVPGTFENTEFVVKRDGSQWRRTNKRRTYGVDGLWAKFSSLKQALGVGRG